MSKEQVAGLVRHLVTFGGGFLIAKGWVDESLVAEAATVVASLVAVMWSIVSKEK